MKSFVSTNALIRLVVDVIYENDPASEPVWRLAELSGPTEEEIADALIKLGYEMAVTPQWDWEPVQVCPVDGGPYVGTVSRFKDGSVFYASNGRYTFRLRCTENGDPRFELTQGRTSRLPTTDDVQRACLAMEATLT